MSEQVVSSASVKDSQPIPSTRGELRQMLAEMMSELLQNPHNMKLFAHSVFAMTTETLATTIQQEARRRATLVIGQAYYPGCIKAVVVPPNEDAGEHLLSVEYYSKDEKDEWVKVELAKGPGSIGEDLTRQILTATAIPGDIYYVVTTEMVEAHAEKIADKILATSSLGLGSMEETLKSVENAKTEEPAADE